MHRARRLWLLLERVHALVYFAPEAGAAFRHAGLRGFWRGYFAGRTAPMGAVGPGPATAALFGFRHDMVARALPEVWSMASPDEALAARLAGVDAALRRILGPSATSSAVAEAAELARRAAEAGDRGGRPLYAANADQPWPDEPHLVLWQAATWLREHRGDGHVALSTAAGLDGCRAHVLQVAAHDVPRESLQPHRGWDDDDWQAALEGLRSRGWLDGDGRATAQGRAAKADLEARTDELADAPLARLGDEPLARLEARLAPVADAVDAAADIPYPNPMGLPGRA